MLRRGLLRASSCVLGQANFSSTHCRSLVTARKQFLFQDKRPPSSIQPVVYLSNLSSIINRGAYDDRFFQHTTGSDVKGVKVVSDGKHIEITWGDGKVSRFHSLWLRATCYCTQCRLDSTGQTCVDFEKVPDDSAVLSAEDDGKGCLLVRWKEDPDHTGLFPLKFLKAHCYSKQELERRRQNRKMTFSTDPVIPRVCYEDVVGSKQGLYKWVKALNEPGIAIVEGVPCEEGMVEKMCQKIADLTQHTIYGMVFNVRSEARPINAAYGAGELKLHMDQVQYEAAPGIQALHCLQFDENVKGGGNIFIDVFHAAETFREQNPEEFDLLCKIPYMFETLHYKRDWPVHMRYKNPLFTLNDTGDIVGVRFHPQLTGPLQVDEEYVEPFFIAYKKFYTHALNFPYVYRNRLRPGEMVSFNNRRVLHGRAAFDSHAGARFLQGCYVEISELKSCLEVLANMEGGGAPVKRVGDMDWQ